MKSRILVVGNANVAFIQRMKKVPEPGQTLVDTDGSYTYVPSGRGANAAVTLARLGANCLFCGKVGNDANGTRLKKMYEAEGIDVRFLATDRTAATGLTSVLLEDNAEKRSVVYPGANQNLTVSDVESAFTCYPDALFMQFDSPDSATLAAARFAAEHQIPIFLDATPVRADFPLNAFKQIEIFTLNEAETEIFTGITPNNVENCLRAAIRLSTNLDVHYVVIKLGKRGSYVYDGKYYRTVSSYLVETVDDNAVGDIYSAALTYDYLVSKDIIHALNFASAAAAISVTKAGAATSAPKREEVLQFIEENGVVLR